MGRDLAGIMLKPLRSFVASLLIAMGLGILPGCLFFEKPHVPGRVETGVTRVELGRSYEDRPLVAWVFPGKRPGVMIIGGIHGDEPSSRDLVLALAEHLAVRPEATRGREVVLVPKANPDGLVAYTRFNVRGIDLNRNFETSNFRADATHGSLPHSELETLALARALARFKPTAVVSVHAPLNCIDPDGGPASGALASAMAAESPLPLKDLRELPGSLGSYVGGNLALKIVTYELDKRRTPVSGGDDYLAKHIPALLAAIRKG